MPTEKEETLEGIEERKKEKKSSNRPPPFSLRNKKTE
jgi:hypothetical protein